MGDTPRGNTASRGLPSTPLAPTPHRGALTRRSPAGPRCKIHAEPEKRRDFFLPPRHTVSLFQRDHPTDGFFLLQSRGAHITVSAMFLFQRGLLCFSASSVPRLLLRSVFHNLVWNFCARVSGPWHEQADGTAGGVGIVNLDVFCLVFLRSFDMDFVSRNDGYGATETSWMEWILQGGSHRMSELRKLLEIEINYFLIFGRLLICTHKACWKYELHFFFYEVVYTILQI